MHRAAGLSAPADECVTRTCVDKTCGTENVAAGTRTSAQTPGDCKQEECDGKGAVVTMTDGADVPIDNQTCTQDVCTKGVPSNPAVMAGTVCSEGKGQLCDAAGQCVECLVANDCAGTDDECKTRTCTAGVCGLDVEPSGTLLAAQVAFDCTTLKCDGNGIEALRAALSAVPHLGIFNRDASIDGDALSNATPSFLVCSRS